MPDPEALAREDIDRQLEAAGWVVQDRHQLNITAGPGVAMHVVPVCCASHLRSIDDIPQLKFPECGV